MATPTLVTITGTLMRDNGLPDEGGVVKASRPLFTSHVDGTVYEPLVETAVADALGNFTLILVASDDPDWMPVGWVYTFKVKPGDGGALWTFTAPVPEADVTLTFGELVPVASPGTPNVYASVNHTHQISSVTGLQAALDGKVTGPGSAVSGRLASYNGTTGKLIADSGISAATLSAQIAELYELAYLNRVERAVIGGEMVMRRADIGGVASLLTGNLYLTHFTASQSFTVATLQSRSVGAGVGGTHGWMGLMQWTGSQYTPVAVTADMPTMWAAANTTYDRPLYQINVGTGLADLAKPGFSLVSGTNYAFYTIWTGSGAAPTIAACPVNIADSMVEPRENAFMALAAPPSGPLQPGWVSPTAAKVQGFLKW